MQQDATTCNNNMKQQREALTCSNTMKQHLCEQLPLLVNSLLEQQQLETAALH